MMDVWGVALVRELLSTLVAFVIPFFTGAAVSHITMRAAYLAGRRREREAISQAMQDTMRGICPCDKCVEARKQQVLQKN